MAAIVGLATTTIANEAIHGATEDAGDRCDRRRALAGWAPDRHRVRCEERESCVGGDASRSRLQTLGHPPIEIGKAHDFRTAADPTYRRLESTETTKTRRVDAYEIGVDLVKRVTVLRARHPGGLITDLPIGEAQLSGVIGGLQRVLDKIKSGERPPPTH